jgi:hypothetical protein
VEPAAGAAGKSSSVSVFAGFAAAFFFSRARRAASATDFAESSCDCARAAPANPVKSKPAAARAINE